MKQTLGVFLILGALVASILTSSPDTVQRDEELRVECPMGWQLLYQDSDHMNPTCIYLDLVDPVSSVEVAKQRCLMMDAWLAEPQGWLHYEIYQRIMDLGYDQEAFWIGGSDQASEGTWIWERVGNPMPMGTPHWAPSQPLPNDRNSNYACILPNDYYFFSCNNDSLIRTLCQKYPIAVTAA